MDRICTNRPKVFASFDEAVDWNISYKKVRDTESVREGLETQLIQRDDGSFTWKYDIMESKPYWNGNSSRLVRLFLKHIDWFQNLNRNFLTSKSHKLLIIAGTERLDKEMTIAHMQGKFQLNVYPESNHFIHQDVPEKLAEDILQFIDKIVSFQVKRFPIVPKKEWDVY